MSDSTRQVGDLNDTELAEYLSRVNLRYVKVLYDLSDIKVGSRPYQAAMVRRRQIEAVYGKGVKEAVSRGMLILH